MKLVKVFTKYDIEWRGINVPQFKEFTVSRLSDDTALEPIEYLSESQLLSPTVKEEGLEGVRFITYEN